MYYRNGYETWSLTLREVCRLRVFLWQVAGPKREEVTGDWRKLLVVELNDWFSSPNITRAIRSRRMGKKGMWNVGKGAVCTGIWWGNIR